MTRFLFFACFLFVAGFGRADVAAESWPRPVRTFPAKLPATISHGGFRLTISTPDDARIREGGGSGGPMLAFRVANRGGGHAVTFYTQSVCAVLLASWHGRPQLEVWGRGGGGYWTRCLHRCVSGKYHCVRCDEFEEWPRHSNARALTIRAPFDPNGEGTELGRILYLVETRIPAFPLDFSP